jgi:integrase
LHLLDGIDPLSERRQARQLAIPHVSFAECAAQYIASHEAGWKTGGGSARQWSASLRDYVFPHIGQQPASQIDTAAVMRTLDEIWITKPETARRVRQRIEAVLAWATTRGYREGDNPARWRGHLENLLPASSRVTTITPYAALPFAEIPAFLVIMRNRQSVSARALEFIVLTATRLKETIGATWREIDLLERVWTIPAARMKAGLEHRVPLSDQAVDVLRRMAEIPHSDDDFIFPGQSGSVPLSRNAPLRELATSGFGRVATVHGARSSFSTWAHERTAFSHEAIEVSLAHLVGSAVSRAYHRGDLFDKRRQLMTAWGLFCATPRRAMGEVVAIGGRS